MSNVIDFPLQRHGRPATPSSGIVDSRSPRPRPAPDVMPIECLVCGCPHLLKILPDGTIMLEIATDPPGSHDDGIPF
jgi:hypothetical protein